jgi:tetratricopeptide (TPR) repeat protein
MSHESCPSPLAGQHIVLIGRFAAITRDELTARLQAAGACLTRDVTSTTKQVIVGQAGWPLRRNGRLPRALIMAQILQARRESPSTSIPEVLTESTFLQRHGWARQQQNHVATPWALEPGPRAFRDFARGRILVDLLRQGIAPRRLQRTLAQLSRWFPEALSDWERLAPEWTPGGWRFRLADGQHVDEHGQRLFDFIRDDLAARDADVSLNILRWRPSAEPDLFATAVTFEQQGDHSAAERTYRALLQRDGPDADVCFNLANVLVALNQRAAAIERLWQCVELTPQSAEAWHNLGTVAWELQRLDLADEAFTRALDIAPNLAAAQHGRDAVRRAQLHASTNP